LIVTEKVSSLFRACDVSVVSNVCLLGQRTYCMHGRTQDFFLDVDKLGVWGWGPWSRRQDVKVMHK